MTRISNVLSRIPLSAIGASLCLCGVAFFTSRAIAYHHFQDGTEALCLGLGAIVCRNLGSYEAEDKGTIQ